jgi:hypothetical protein
MCGGWNLRPSALSAVSQCDGAMTLERDGFAMPAFAIFAFFAFQL